MPCSSHSARSFAEEVERRDIETALPLHRLDDDGGDARRVGGIFEQGVQRSEALLAADPVIGVREGNVVDIGRERSEALLVGNDLAGQRHAHMRATVKAAAERDDPRAAGKGARDLHRILDGFRAGRDQHGLGGVGDRRKRVQPLRQAHIRFIRRDLEADMAERLHLLLDGSHDLRMLMPGIDHGNAGAEVDIALAVLAPDLGVLGALGVDGGGMADAARHGRHPPLMQLGRTWH